MAFCVRSDTLVLFSFGQARVDLVAVSHLRFGGVLPFYNNYFNKL